MRTLALASTIALLGIASTADAHFLLQAPPQTSNDTVGGKGNPPCGPDTNDVTTPTAAQGGHPFMLKIDEFVPHSGFYRVALALNSRSEIPVDNVVYDSTGKVLPPSGMPMGQSNTADYENPAVFPVLADNLFPHTGTGPMTFMGSVMLPNVNCDRCILQVIEFMHPHPFNTSTPGPGGGYFYHHCAELKITADPSMPLYPPGGNDGGAAGAGTPQDASPDLGGAGGTGSTGAAGSSGAAGEPASGTGGTTGSGSGGTTTQGAAGASVTGSGGTLGPGTGGSTTTGSAGSAGSRSSGGGGCSIYPGGGSAPLDRLALTGAFTALFVLSRRRETRRRSR
jgi:hypothetical protein